MRLPTTSYEVQQHILHLLSWRVIAIQSVVAKKRWILCVSIRFCSYSTCMQLQLCCALLLDDPFILAWNQVQFYFETRIAKLWSINPDSRLDCSRQKYHQLNVLGKSSDACFHFRKTLWLRPCMDLKINRMAGFLLGQFKRLLFQVKRMWEALWRGAVFRRKVWLDGIWGDRWTIAMGGYWSLNYKFFIFN